MSDHKYVFELTHTPYKGTPQTQKLDCRQTAERLYTRYESQGLKPKLLAFGNGHVLEFLLGGWE